MKIRQGFVSNSSASSFCIYGAHFSDINEAVELISEIGGDIMLVDQAKALLGGDEGDPNDLLEQWADKEDLSFIRGPDGDGVYIGREWSSVKDDETGHQFKDSIEEKLKTIFGKVAFGTLSEAWYDG
jgi:hypothetical protein